MDEFWSGRQSLTRAEQLRQKRQQTEAQKRQQAPAKKYPQAPAQQRPTAARSTTTRNIPHGSSTTNRSVPHVSPMVSRSIRYGTPLRQAVNTQPRRKVVYRVGANGVETACRLCHHPVQLAMGFCFPHPAFLVLALLLTNLSIVAVNRIEVKECSELPLPISRRSFKPPPIQCSPLIGRNPWMRSLSLSLS
jgi:hypothetical protein